MNDVNCKRIKWAGILLLTGGLFWDRAFYRPYSGQRLKKP